MSWSGRVFDKYKPLSSTSDSTDSLPHKVSAFIQQQIESWPALSAGIEALSLIETKRIGVNGTTSEVVVQHNPARIRSTSARVDAQSVASRRCFLCPENMPPEEKSIQYGDDLMITCNPFPVLANHLSIIHRDHVEQKIDGNLEALLSLARDFGPDYFLLYNGPRSGASAPDHLHFQACSRSLLPIEADLRRHLNTVATNMQEGQESRGVHLLDDCGRAAFVLVSNQIERLTGGVYFGIARLAEEAGEKREPMMNIIVTFDAPVWTVYVFPRARHRPASFFAEGDDRLTVSPGAIDMAGIVVVPEVRDFDKLNSQSIAAIFAEVSVGLDVSRRVLSSMREHLKGREWR